MMPLSTAEHATVVLQTVQARTTRARERRAAGGLVYRKVPIVVSILETVDAEGVRCLPIDARPVHPAC